MHNRQSGAAHAPMPIVILLLFIAIGSGIAVVGAGLYGWLKAKYADQTKTLKRD